MKTDRIFVLLLVVMLPLSGCFDDAVGDAEGADDANAGTTVINNYYNNSTTVLQNSAVMLSANAPHFAPDGSVGGVIINSSSNQMIEIMSIWTNYSSTDALLANDVIHVDVNCSSFENTIITIDYGNHGGHVALPTDGSNCSYNFYIKSNAVYNPNPHIFVNYIIHN